MPNATGGAVIFDLDGTLIDSLPDVVGAMNLLLAEESRRAITVAEGQRMVGEGAVAMVERAFSATGATVSGSALEALTARYVTHYRATPVKDTTIYPGVLDVLRRFESESIPMGVCTNKPHDMSRIVLDALGLDRFFSAMIGGDALEVKKPDAGHVFAVLDEMDADRDTAVFVGDSPTDMAAARNAGLPSVAVAYGYSKVPAEELDADVLIQDFSALPDAIASLASPSAAVRSQGT